MSSPAGIIRTSTDRSVAFLDLDRPPLNVLDRPMLASLESGIARAVADESLCALVIRGAGMRSFSAGVDLEDHKPDAARAMLRAVHGVVVSLVRAPIVTIAAIRGFCLGGGLEIATSCDLVIAEADSTLGQPEVRVGCFPPVACARLASLVGRAQAADMILTGQPITAARALEIGLVSRLGPVDRTLEEVLGWVRALSRPVLRAAVLAMRQPEAATLDRRLAEAEALYEQHLIGTHDMNEGIEAFLEKRAPNWKHA